VATVLRLRVMTVSVVSRPSRHGALPSSLGEARDVRGGGDDDLVTSGLDLGVRRVLRQGAEANALVEVRGGLQPGVGGGANGRLDRGPDGRGENVIRRRRAELTLGLGLGGGALAVATGVVAVTAVIVLTRDPLAKSVGALTLLLRLGVLLGLHLVDRGDLRAELLQGGELLVGGLVTERVILLVELGLQGGACVGQL